VPPSEAAPPFTIVVPRSADELVTYLEAWDELAAAALEPNVYYEPWLLLPAVRAFGAGVELRFVLVLAKSPNSNKPILCGFFPLERRRSYKGLPVSCLSLWRHAYCFLCLPLLRASCARECLDVFMNWLVEDQDGAALMEWPWAPAEGPTQHLLIDQTLQRGRLALVVEQFTRGILQRRADAETYLNAALPARSRKELRRKEKRQAEMGRVEYVTLHSPGDLEMWIETFLRLEVSGWKGRRGGAMACTASDADFFRGVVAEAFRRGRLLMLGLFVDGQAIAMKCSFLAGGGSFAFKIAFDEEKGRASPGYLLEVANIREVHQRPDIAWMDSCTDLRPSMFDQLWIDRRAIQTLLLSSGRAAGDLAVSILPLLRWVKRRLNLTDRGSTPC
jgi:hypothetical protein